MNVKHFITSRSQQFASLIINFKQTSPLRVQQLRPVTPGTPNVIFSTFPLRVKNVPVPLLNTSSRMSDSKVEGLAVDTVATPVNVPELILAHVCGLFRQSIQLSFPTLGVIRNSSIKTLTSVIGVVVGVAVRVKLLVTVETGFAVEVLF